MQQTFNAHMPDQLFPGEEERAPAASSRWFPHGRPRLLVLFLLLLRGLFPSSDLVFLPLPQSTLWWEHLRLCSFSSLKYWLVAFTETQTQFLNLTASDSHLWVENQWSKRRNTVPLGKTCDITLEKPRPHQTRVDRKNQRDYRPVLSELACTCTNWKKKPHRSVAFRRFQTFRHQNFSESALKQRATTTPRKRGEKKEYIFMHTWVE